MGAHGKIEEKELLLRMQRGDPRAFEALYRLHSSTVYRKILSMVKIADTAEEITQELFIKVWNKRELIDPDREFIYYILQMASNLVMDFYRRMARTQKLQQEVIAISTELYSHSEEELIFKESKSIIDNAIASLPPQQKLVFTLCKLEGKSYAEVSAELGISTSTISNHIVQATKTVKLILYSAEKPAIAILCAMLLS
ncbi:RNA polymerase sigma factor [Pedobacter sp.]